MQTLVNSLNSTVTAQKQQIAGLAQQVTSLASQQVIDETALAAVTDRTKYMSVSGTDTYFTGTNVNIRNGRYALTAVNGLGNLIVGFNRVRRDGTNTPRDGSHNIVFGEEASYRSEHGLIGGVQSVVDAPYGVITTGTSNSVHADFGFVASGLVNSTYGRYGALMTGSQNSITERVTYGLVGTGLRGSIWAHLPTSCAVILTGYDNQCGYDSASVVLSGSKVRALGKGTVAGTGQFADYDVPFKYFTQ